MKTPFQNYMLQVLREQTVESNPSDLDVLLQVGDSIQSKPSVPEVTPEIKPDTNLEVPENEIPPVEIPQGLVPGPDENGDGFPDYFEYDTGEVDADGNPIITIYQVEWVLVEINGEMVVTPTFTYEFMGYNLAYANGMWTLLFTNSSGNPILIPNLTIARFLPNGSIQWVYQDHVGNYWFTGGDPTATNPTATWTNPYTGGQASGDAVSYPTGWSASLGIKFDVNGNPLVANIPLVPGGSFIPPGSIPGQSVSRPGANDWAIQLNLTIPFGGPGSNYGWVRHRSSWDIFYTWHTEHHGFPPPNGTGGFPSWPENSDWWDDWSEDNL